MSSGLSTGSSPTSMPIPVGRCASASSTCAPGTSGTSSRQPASIPPTSRSTLCSTASGRIALNGQADFLAAPHAAVKAEFTLEQIELAQFQAVASRHNLALKRGVLSAAGTIEYAPTVKIVHLRQATIDRLQADYIHTAQTAVVEQRRVQQVKQVAQEVSNAPGILLRADQLRLVHGTLGFVNRAARPDYRLFLDDAEVHLQNFSNQLTEGTAVAKVTGRVHGQRPDGSRGLRSGPRPRGRISRSPPASKTPRCPP